MGFAALAFGAFAFLAPLALEVFFAELFLAGDAPFAGEAFLAGEAAFAGEADLAALGVLALGLAPLVFLAGLEALLLAPRRD